MIINFIKTCIPIQNFKEKEIIGNKIILRLDAVKDDQMYNCVECTINQEDYTESEVTTQYNQWKLKQSKYSINLAKKTKIQEITDYDQSSKVNGFLLNNQLVWLDKATRVGLMNSTQIEKDSGKETTELWLGTTSLNINCDIAISLLKQLELYALKCFNITAKHKKEIEECDNIDEITNYDVTKDYPEQLTINI